MTDSMMLYSPDELAESDDWLRRTISETIHTGTENDAVPPAEKKEIPVEN